MVLLNGSNLLPPVVKPPADGGLCGTSGGPCGFGWAFLKCHFDPAPRAGGFAASLDPRSEASAAAGGAAGSAVGAVFCTLGGGDVEGEVGVASADGGEAVEAGSGDFFPKSRPGTSVATHDLAATAPVRALTRELCRRLGRSTPTPAMPPSIATPSS